MTDASPGDPSPGAAQTTDEHSDTTEEIGPEAVSDAIRAYRADLDAARTEALEYLENKHDLDSDRHLYRAAGFAGDDVQITITLPDAELYVLLDLLDQLTDEPQAAQAFIPQAGALDALMVATPTEHVVDWLTADLEASDLEAADDPTIDDGEEDE